MAEQRNGDDGLVRSQTFEAGGPLEVDVDVPGGRVDIHLGEGDTVVEVRQDDSSPPWAEPASGLLNWVGDFFGGQFGPGQFGGQFGGGQFGAGLAGTPADLVEQTRIEKLGDHLVVRTPKALPPRGGAVAVTVRAPEGSHLTVRTRFAAVTVTGTAGRVSVSTGSGDVAIEQADGAAMVRTGSGSVRIGTVANGLQLRSGSGDVDIATLSGSATLGTGGGDVWLGEVNGAVMVRTSSGDVSVRDAVSGSLEAIVGSGDVRVGIRSGVGAEIDLSSGGGRVSSELDVSDTPPDTPVALTVRARSGSGTATVTRAG